MKRWLDSWSVSESEPTWGQTIVAGLVFVLAMTAMCGCIWLIYAAMDLP